MFMASFNCNVSIKVGNRAKTSFWDDDWIGNRPLKETFPDLFNLVQHPQATVAEIWSLQGWNVNFINDWEGYQSAKFLKLLESSKGTIEYLWNKMTDQDRKEITEESIM